MGQALCVCSRSAITIDNKRYYFIQKLDEGGFSYVDLVEGAQDGRFYALKRILCHDREARQEAQTEVEMHRLFCHPNILSLAGHAFMERGGKCEACLLLPYISRGSLWSVLEKLRDKNSFMPESRILHILHGICAGLKAIHDQGYAHRVLREQWIRAKYERQEFTSEGMHLQKVYSSGLYEGSLWKKGRDNGQFLKRRFVLSQRDFTLRYFTDTDQNISEGQFLFLQIDLKPTNVLLEEDDRAVLMDLGSMNRARIEVRGSREAMTVQDWAAQRCTISYRAPELFSVESHCIIDERTDIWSLGCVLYCMMMLEGPFDLVFQKGDSVALAVQNPVSIPQPCRYSQGLQTLLSSTMVSNPQERPDVGWVLEQVRNLQSLQSLEPAANANMV